MTDDTRLHALFASSPIPDDGFSHQVTASIRRQMRINRYAVPIAFIIGSIFAAFPVAEIASGFLQLATFWLQEVTQDIDTFYPSPAVIICGSAGIVFLSAFRLLEDFR